MDTKTKTDLFYLLTNYVNEVFAEFQLGDDWPESVHLPLYLQGGYHYKEAKLQGQTCLLMLGKGGEQTDKAAALKKHLNIIGQRFPGPVIYIVENTTSFNRKRLVDQRIAFIVPGKQLYLPFAATDLRDHFTATNRLPAEEPKQLSAVAQQMVLLQLYQRWDENAPAQHIADRLAVSKMTVSRAYTELTACGLANTVAIGRQKQLRFMTHGLELWEQAQPYLRDPIKKRLWIDLQAYEDYQYRFGIEAGETALSELGMIMTPKHRTVAINAKDWPSLKKLLNIVEQPYAYGDSVAVELWRYDPTLLSESETVDPLSLYLSLDDKQDDRLAIEKNELLTGLFEGQGNK
jgi:DNA-binding MarR family transcriptional regulator